MRIRLENRHRHGKQEAKDESSGDEIVFPERHRRLPERRAPKLLIHGIPVLQGQASSPGPSFLSRRRQGQKPLITPSLGTFIIPLNPEEIKKGSESTRRTVLLIFALDLPITGCRQRSKPGPADPPAADRGSRIKDLAVGHGIREWGLALDDEHAVSVGEETEPLSDGLPVSAHDQVVAGESRDEHQKGGLGQVKVCQKPVDGMELESRVNK